MRNNKKLIISILSIIAIIALGTYAWIIWNSSNNTTMSMTIGDLVDIKFTNGNDISTNSLIPVLDYNDGEITTFSVKNKADNDYIIDINIDITSIDNNLKVPSFKYKLLKSSTQNGTYTIFTEDSFENKAVGSNAIATIKIPANSTLYFKFILYIDSNMENNTNMMNKSLVATLNATATDDMGLPDFILNSNAPLDSVNSTYVLGRYDSYTVRNEDKAILKTYIMNSGMSSSDADQCIANEGTEWMGCLEYYLEQYNQENDPDIQLVGVGTNTPGIDFTKVSSDTNGRGLYIRSGTEGDAYPIYYYRGAVDNNNVYFANYCWKIVRTTDTGGLKMIYNGTPTSGSCGSGTTSQNNAIIGNSEFNFSHNDLKYVGYTYDNNGVETDSTIKSVIDTWYQTNLLTSYDSYIEDTVYCNDREESSVSELLELDANIGLNISYKPAVRYYIEEKPSLECKNKRDKYTKSRLMGNGKLDYPVGLLTMDEIFLAGEDNDYGTLSNNYLTMEDTMWWSLSPRGYDGSYISGWIMDYSGLYGYYSVGNSCGVRPVISLNSGQNFEYGNGTGENPYRFVATIPSS